MARQTCSSCGGSGKTSTACYVCNGTGSRISIDGSSERCPASNCNYGRVEERCSACGGSGYTDDGRSESSSSSYDSSSSYTPTSSGSTPSTPNAKKIVSEQFYNQAVEMDKKGKYSEAVDLYTKAINAFGDTAYHVVTYAMRGQAYYNLKQYDNAIDDLTKSLDNLKWNDKLKRESVEAAYLMLGNSWLESGSKDAAVKVFKIAADKGFNSSKQKLAEFD